MKFITRTSSLICLQFSLLAILLATSTAYSSQGIHAHGDKHHERTDSYDNLPSLTLIVDEGNMVHLQHLTYTAMDHILKHLHDFYEFSFVDSTQQPHDYSSLSEGVDLLLIQSPPESEAGEGADDFIWTLSYKDESYVNQYKVLALIDFLHKDDMDPAVSNFFAVMNSMTQAFSEMIAEDLPADKAGEGEQTDQTDITAHNGTGDELDLTTTHQTSLHEDGETLDDSSSNYATVEVHVGDRFYSSSMDYEDAALIVAELSSLVDASQEPAFYTFHINNQTTHVHPNIDNHDDSAFMAIAMSDMFGVSYKYLGDELVYSIDEPSADKAVLIATNYTGSYDALGNQYIQTLILTVATQQLYDHLHTLLAGNSLSFYSHVQEALEALLNSAEAGDTAASLDVIDSDEAEGTATAETDAEAQEEQEEEAAALTDAATEVEATSADSNAETMSTDTEEVSAETLIEDIEEVIAETDELIKDTKEVVTELEALVETETEAGDAAASLEVMDNDGAEGTAAADTDAEAQEEQEEEAAALTDAATEAETTSTDSNAETMSTDTEEVSAETKALIEDTEEVIAETDVLIKDTKEVVAELEALVETETEANDDAAASLEVMDNDETEGTAAAETDAEAQEEQEEEAATLTDAATEAETTSADSSAETMSTDTEEVTAETEALVETETDATQLVDMDESEATQEDAKAQPSHVEHEWCTTPSSADGLLEQLLDIDPAVSITFKKVINYDDGSILYCAIISEFLN